MLFPMSVRRLLHLVKRLNIVPAAISFASAITLIFFGTKSLEFLLKGVDEAHKAFHPSLIWMKIEGLGC
jgi:hypothetical protein